MHAMEARGEVPKGTAARWEEHTKDKSLPEYVEKPKAKKKKKKHVLIGKWSGPQNTKPPQSLPDFQSIYYQPESEERDEQEAAAIRTRQEDTISKEKQIIGMHGTPPRYFVPSARFYTQKPVLRQESVINQSRRLAETNPAPSNASPQRGRLFIRR